MSDKHAPGPWTMTVYPPDDYGAEDSCAYIDDGNGKHVAHCLPLSKNNDQLRDANARLIAAAPELLEALRMWLDIHETPAGFAGKYGKALDAAIAAQQLRVEAAASAARAAIAKSTGGAA